MPPGYFIIDEFWDYQCVVYPETNFVNDSIHLTEKICKAAITRSIPWPIGGAHIDVLYNQLGVKTAWNLLPDHLKSYNYEKNHVKRYTQCVEAIRWMGEHPEVLVGPEANAIREHNYTWMFANTIDTIGVIKLDQIIQEYKK